MNKKELDEFENMTLEEKKNKIIEIIRKIPDESPIHKALYEGIKEIMRNEPTKRLQALHREESLIQNAEAEEKGEGEKGSQE